jgi:hypothetical protein
MTTREKTDSLPPLEKIAVLASDLDILRSQMEQQIIQEKSLDDLVDLVWLDELSGQFGVSLGTMKTKLQAVGGKVFKLGKKYVIRKVNFLEVLEHLEQA